MLARRPSNLRGVLLKPEDEAVYLFAMADSAQLSQEVSHRSFWASVIVFVDVFLLALLRFGYLDHAWTVDRSERQEGKSKRGIGGQDREAPAISGAFGLKDEHFEPRKEYGDSNESKSENRKRDSEFLHGIDGIDGHNHSSESAQSLAGIERQIDPIDTDVKGVKAGQDRDSVMRRTVEDAGRKEPAMVRCARVREKEPVAAAGG